MKLLHLSDLHIGKRVNGFSLLEDQEFILRRIISIIDTELPDGIIIAGDVYDKPVPSAEAVELLDSFIVRLAERHIQTFIISGNHDSPERLAFGNRLIDLSGIHISPVYDGSIRPFTLSDEYGDVNIYMLPFVKPANVRQYFPDKEILSYTDALAAAIEELHIDTSKRNVLVTHQFVTGAMRSDSEELSVGGTDNVDAAVMEGFDYTALGHIHGPQNIGSNRIRYCGTPLKYSFSEANHQKSVTVVELGRKGELELRMIPLAPLHDMKEIRGCFDELTAKEYYEGAGFVNDYLHVTLTDEQDVPQAAARLMLIYPNLMKLDYDNSRTRNRRILSAENAQADKRTPLELFADFYEQQNGSTMTTEQTSLVSRLIEEIWEGEK